VDAHTRTTAEPVVEPASTALTPGVPAVVLDEAGA
jgi:hypothetical protein